MSKNYQIILLALILLIGLVSCGSTNATPIPSETPQLHIPTQGETISLPSATLASTNTPEPTLTVTPRVEIATATPLAPLSGSGGGIIAFSRGPAVSDGEIYLMNADGSDLRQLTQNTSEDTAPAWSPDGQYIVFAAQRGDNWDIYYLDAGPALQGRATSSPQVLKSTSYDDFFPVWSPDGSQIAFVANIGGDWGVWVVDISAVLAGGTAGEPQLLISGLSDNQDSFDWSPDGTRIAYTREQDGNREIYLVNVQDALAGNPNPQRLTYNEIDDFSPCWSPDGTQIAYYARLNHNYEIFSLDVEQALQTAGSSGTQQLTNNDVDDWWPRWSADGSKIVFTSFDPSGNYHDIYLMDVNGTHRQPLTADSQDNWFPAWRP